MAKIAGYYLTWGIDQGDAWVNAVDPKTETGIMHKECAWNTENLSLLSDVTDLQRISYEEAEQHDLKCGYCAKPLTTKRYYAFSPQYNRAEEP